MDPFLIFIILVAAVVAGIVWAAVVVVTTIVRVTCWGVSLPFRAFRCAGSKAKVNLSSNTLGRHCGNEKCGASLPDVAKFCPRCGSQVAGAKQLSRSARAGIIAAAAGASAA